MLILTFYVDETSYGINCQHIFEVIPHVHLKRSLQSPDYVAGSVNFYGLPVTVIDFCRLVAGRASASCLHTRILILNISIDVSGVRHLSILAEKIVEIIDIKPSEYIAKGFIGNDLPYLGEVVSQGEKTVHLVNVDKLFEAMQGIGHS